MRIHLYFCSQMRAHKEKDILERFSRRFEHWLACISEEGASHSLGNCGFGQQD